MPENSKASQSLMCLITFYQAYCLICKLPLALTDVSLAHAGCILSDPGLPGSQPLQ